GVTPRQSINIACRAMTSAKALTRATEDCARCKRVKIINCLGTTAMRTKAAGAVAPPPLGTTAYRVRNAGADGAGDPLCRISNYSRPQRSEVTRVEGRNMTSRCYLVSCVSVKQAAPSRAKDLYLSD